MAFVAFEMVVATPVVLLAVLVVFVVEKPNKNGLLLGVAIPK